MAASRTRAGAGSAAGAAADFPIDIVIPWVDGNDPAWQAQRAKYAPRATGDSAAEYRFRDWGLMRYWFRSIDAFAPWVRRIYFVTCGQRPEWLNTADPRLVCVDHSDYIPADYLPTFDSNTIEIFCNRIPGLAEHFVLFNDDTFLVGPTTREDFFEGGLPKDDAVLGIIFTDNSTDLFAHTMLSNSAVINRHFSLPEVWRAHKGKFMSSKLDRGARISNFALFHTGGFGQFRINHLPTAFLKSTFDELWRLEPEAMLATAQDPFRSPFDVTQHLAAAWQYCKGKFVPRGGQFGRNFKLGPDTADAVAAVTSGAYKTICLNDSGYEGNFEADQAQLAAAFEQLLPQRCGFELS